MKILITIVMLTFTLSVYGQDDIRYGRQLTNWQKVYADLVTNPRTGLSGETEVYVAPETIKRGDDEVNGWMRFVLPQGSGFVKPGTDFGELRYLLTLHCEDIASARAWVVIGYDRSGRYYGGVDLRREREESGPEIPASVGHYVYEYFCERGTVKTDTPPQLKSVRPRRVNPD